MISRVYTRCLGCGRPTAIRVGVGQAKRQRILVHCPNCGASIRGTLTLGESEANVELEGHVITPEPDDPQQAQVITTHPDFPHNPTADIESPFISASLALGDHFLGFMKGLGGFHHTIEAEWPTIERAYGYYLDENWGLFDRSMQQLLGDNWPESPTELGRHDIVHRILSIVLMPLGPSGDYPKAKDEIWTTSRVEIETFARFCAEPSVLEEVRRIQRRIFDQIRRLLANRDAWISALILAYLDAVDRPTPDDWQLPGDDFHLLRDAYRQNFELCCQSLFLVVAAKNAADGRPAKTICSADYSDGWVPSTDKSVATRELPRTVAQFRSKRAEIKVLYLDAFPITDSLWKSLFDRKLRNAISHADAHFDSRRGVIELPGEETLRYLDFVKSTVGQLQMLMLFVDFAKLCRIYALAASSE